MVTTSAIINRAWRLVIEQGHSRASAARQMGITERRVDLIIGALHQRRRRLETLQALHS